MVLPFRIVSCDLHISTCLSQVTSFYRQCAKKWSLYSGPSFRCLCYSRYHPFSYCKVMSINATIGISLLVMPTNLTMLSEAHFVHVKDEANWVFFLMPFSLNWQHQLCKNPRPNPDIKTLFTDHSCAAPTNGARAPPPANGPLGSIPKSAGFPPMGAHAVSIVTIRPFNLS
jgi:hypothetical protein